MPLLLSFTPTSPLACPHSLTITSLLSPKPRKSLRVSNPILDRSLSLFSYLHVLPPDFAQRWRNLVETSEEAEARLCQIPVHLVQAVTASEDCRFFYHLGVDPHGIGRAVVNYPNGGGGSTITQQLMKRIFLSSERTMSRKFIEGLLSLIVEKRMSKRQILYSYLSKMYWGHGIFGIEAASEFYFGKHPNFLDVGESALLAGILPGPEFLNPYTNPKRGKRSQVRVLRRMVASGFLDLDEALDIANQPLYLRTEVKTNRTGEAQMAGRT
ncbi:uncharacterized protein A4U43_C08F23740 [Asparagus officinalis]|uniref:uncharacterized protein LOC109820049 n=1 Tax=Asparagus officinalis TaxID=4686 RepID=UPI00098E5565|nr:uncharacterized protein LOC109820049 [Asparagus officinalis]ONK60887.1 uncharacterized protein A4U43_C08F23740 [Asparagus officinalis]